MKLLINLILALSMIGCANAGVNAPEETLRIEPETIKGVGVCSATAIGKKTLLTASHCVPEVLVNLKVSNHYFVLDTIPSKVIHDGRDNAIIIFDYDIFKKYAKVDFSSNPLNQGDQVSIFGNGSRLFLMYRQGYVAGQIPGPGYDFQMYDLNGYFGDSGSCIFHNDVCVGVVSGVVGETDQIFDYKLFYSQPFNFTPEQLELVK